MAAELATRLAWSYAHFGRLCIPIPGVVTKFQSQIGTPAEGGRALSLPLEREQPFNQ